MEPTKVLVVEDDDLVARTIEMALRRTGYNVTVTSSGGEGLKVARRLLPDVIILDVVMPGMDGLAVCREIRSDPLLTRTPVIFLTAKIKEEDRIQGFQAGADDYICKPFSVEEFRLRVAAQVRRSQFVPPPAATDASSGPLTMDLSPLVQALQANSGPLGAGENYLVVGDYLLNTRTFTLYTPARQQILLTPMQYDLIYHLMSHPGQVYSTSRLLREVWNYPSHSGSPDLVRVHIKNLRRKIEADPRNPRFLHTVPGYGYMVAA